MYMHGVCVWASMCVFVHACVCVCVCCVCMCMCMCMLANEGRVFEAATRLGS